MQGTQEPHKQALSLSKTHTNTDTHTNTEGEREKEKDTHPLLCLPPSAGSTSAVAKPEVTNTQFIHPQHTWNGCCFWSSLTTPEQPHNGCRRTGQTNNPQARFTVTASHASIGGQ